jgi:hypothetical protein
MSRSTRIANRNLRLPGELPLHWVRFRGTTLPRDLQRLLAMCPGRQRALLALLVTLTGCDTSAEA